MPSENKLIKNGNIATNKKARHDYTIEEAFEAGMCLEGWEVKSAREGRVQLRDSHVIIRKSEAFLIGCHITPLKTASTHILPDPTRIRKLLLNRRELNKLMGKIEQKGFTIVPLSMYFKRNKVKLEIAFAKGKKMYDKRAAQKEKDWARQKQKQFKLT